MKFEPVYWMLEPTDLKHNVVAIYDNDLMALIVSLSSIGSGNSLVYNQAVAQLEEWIAFKLGRSHTEKTTLVFLRYVRDWGPLRMEPLFYGLKEVLERLQIPDLEKIYFEYYADNCGVGDNRHGRLLAVNMLEVMGTRKARVALLEIYKLSKNQDIQPEELKLIKKAIRGVAHKKARIEGGAHQSFPDSGAIREKPGQEKPPEKTVQSTIVSNISDNST